MTVLPPMSPEQTASWIGLLDLYDHLQSGWTLIGGQLVHLHCAERGQFPVRPTNDADTVVDVRADPSILHTFTKTVSEHLMRHYLAATAPIGNVEAEICSLMGERYATAAIDHDTLRSVET
jgi:hypothetical protein